MLGPGCCCGVEGVQSCWSEEQLCLEPIITAWEPQNLLLFQTWPEAVAVLGHAEKAACCPRAVGLQGPCCFPALPWPGEIRAELCVSCGGSSVLSPEQTLPLYLEVDWREQHLSLCLHPPAAPHYEGSVTVLKALMCKGAHTVLHWIRETLSTNPGWGMKGWRADLWRGTWG